jgi:hypothetical protein
MHQAVVVNWIDIFDPVSDLGRFDLAGRATDLATRHGPSHPSNHQLPRM